VIGTCFFETDSEAALLESLSASNRGVSFSVCLTVYNETPESVLESILSIYGSGCQSDQAGCPLVIEVHVIFDCSPSSLQVYVDALRGILVNPVVRHISSCTVPTLASCTYLSSEESNGVDLRVPVKAIYLWQKVGNFGKLKSQKLYFDVVCSSDENLVHVQLDAGTVIPVNGLFLAQEAFDSDSRVSAIVPYVNIALAPQNALVGWQYDDYYWAHVSIRRINDVFGYSDVLPGQFACYRNRALRRHVNPLSGLSVVDLYTQSESTKSVNSWSSMTEDRVLSFCLMFAGCEPGAIRYVPRILVVTDACVCLEELLLQRRRWMNGSISNSVHQALDLRVWKFKRLAFAHLFASVWNTLSVLYHYVLLPIIVGVLYSGHKILYERGMDLSVSLPRALIYCVPILCVALWLSLCVAKKGKWAGLLLLVKAFLIGGYSSLIAGSTVCFAAYECSASSIIAHLLVLGASLLFFTGGLFVFHRQMTLRRRFSFAVDTQALQSIIGCFAICGLLDRSWGTKGLLANQRLQIAWGFILGLLFQVAALALVLVLFSCLSAYSYDLAALAFFVATAAPFLPYWIAWYFVREPV
jgi:cellulose synthase/poly-beta-1,6-N-acetylglucosamine synthase-like glycosyltransferase